MVWVVARPMTIASIVSMDVHSYQRPIKIRVVRFDPGQSVINSLFGGHSPTHVLHHTVATGRERCH